MERESRGLIESNRENPGRNVTIHAYFVRHGEKGVSLTTADTGLSPRGREQSQGLGASLHPRQAIKGKSSLTDRTDETRDLIVETSPTAKKMTPRHEQGLTFVYDKNGCWFKKVLDLKQKILGDDFKNQRDIVQRSRMQQYELEQHNQYLAYGDRRPDSKTYSPKETAATVAAIVDKYIRMADRLDEGSDIDLINATHDHVIESFLKEVIGFKDLKEIGGPISFDEGFEIVIHNDESGNKTAVLKFRARDYPIDQQQLEQLVAITKQLKS